jgi:hypothetical protein
MLLRMTLLATLLAGICMPAAADLSPGLRALIEDFQSHRRVALGYLRTQNGDLGAFEIERLLGRWAADRRALPPADAADAVLIDALARSERLLADSLRAADGGDVERAQQALEEAGALLVAWRRSRGIRLFSDCVAEIGAAYERLDRHRINRPDLADAPQTHEIASAASATLAALDRCHLEAPAQLRREPEYRRLFDGMRASLQQIPEALAARDGALLHRLLIEQRSFERLLAFRFG